MWHDLPNRASDAGPDTSTSRPEPEPEYESEEEQDGYVFEEIAECLLILGRAAESQPYFAQAYALLSQDIWLVAQEKERLEHLKQLGEESDEASGSH